MSEPSDFHSYFEEAIQYRIVSVFLQDDIERILLKVNEDIEIVLEDTKNLNFLVQNLEKFDQGNDTYRLILEQLTDSIQNAVLRDDKFDEDYFAAVKEASAVIQAIL